MFREISTVDNGALEPHNNFTAQGEFAMNLLQYQDNYRGIDLFRDDGYQNIDILSPFSNVKIIDDSETEAEEEIILNKIEKMTLLDSLNETNDSNKSNENNDVNTMTPIQLE